MTLLRSPARSAVRSPIIRRGSGFSPVDLGQSLLAWWDASYGITVTGAGVSSWLDRRNGYNLVQATDGSRPSYSATGFNGAPGLTFDGTADHLTLASQPFPSGSAPSELWGVLQQDDVAADTTVRVFAGYGGIATNIGRAIQRVVTTGTNRLRGATGTGSSVLTANATTDASSRHVVRLAVGATASDFYVDGDAAVNAAAVPTTGTVRMRVGGSLADTPIAFWEGKVRDVIVTGPLTTAQASALQTFLLARRML